MPSRRVSFRLRARLLAELEMCCRFRRARSRARSLNCTNARVRMRTRTRSAGSDAIAVTAASALGTLRVLEAPSQVTRARARATREIDVTPTG